MKASAYPSDSPGADTHHQEEAVDESIAMNEKAGEHTIPEKFARQAEGAADD